MKFDRIQLSLQTNTRLLTKNYDKMKRKLSSLLLFAALLLAGQGNVLAVNTKTTVSQVTTAVTLSDDVGAMHLLPVMA